MTLFFIVVILICGTVLVLNRRLMQIVMAMEKSKMDLETELRSYVDEDCETLVDLFEQYMNMEKDPAIETGKERYAQSVLQYKHFLAHQPWKTLAWVLKLPAS